MNPTAQQLTEITEAATEMAFDLLKEEYSDHIANCNLTVNPILASYVDERPIREAFAAEVIRQYLLLNEK